jgi:uroporphyrin-III C-methyltransferase/precorrin-2 dehydrogenase/sirohydrochlorin ferrochelatase
MRYFPLFLDSRARSILIVGGGARALARLRLLLKSEAQIHLVAPKLEAEIEALARSGRITWLDRPFRAEDVSGHSVVFAAADEAAVNQAVSIAARAAGVLVNVLDDGAASDALMSAIVDRDPVVVAIGTEGTAPSLARGLKAELEARLSPRLGTLARLASARRNGVMGQQGPRLRDAWRQFFDGAGERVLAAEGEQAAERLLDGLLRAALEAPAPAGRVVLVGAGPGDPDLLTLKARKYLDAAEVVLYDRLVDRRILELARREARLIDVGKAPSGQAMPQQAINALMVREAAAGQFVVRLKSGDPLLFGRADEELAALDAAGIGYEIVPGISSATAAAAAAGFSLTSRGRNRSVSFITAHAAEGFAEHDWRSLARPDAAFAIFMGVRAARFVQGRLMLHGARAETPVTLVENASRPAQKIIAGALADLTRLMSEHDIRGPAIIFIGLAPTAARQALVTAGGPVGAAASAHG